MKGRAVGSEPAGLVGSRALRVALLVVTLAGALGAQQPPFPPAEAQPPPPELTGVAGQVRPATVAEYVSLDYVNTAAEDVVNAIARSTGKNVVWAAKATKQARVTVHVRNVEWRDALRMVLDQIGGVIIEETPTRVLIDTPKPITAEWVEDDLKLVIETIGRIGDASIIVGPQVDGTVTARVVNQPWTKVLQDIVGTAGFITVREGNVIRVVHPATLQKQLVTRVFKLKYVMPPDSYRPRIDSEYLAGGPVATGSDARRALAAMGAGYQPAFAGQLGAPRAAAPTGAQATKEVTFPLFYAVQRVLTPGIGQVTYDPDRNALIVTDTEPVLKQLETVLARIDTEPEQVFVDVKFVTIAGPITTADADNVTDLLEFGVDWSQGIWASHAGPAGIPSTFPWGGSRPGFGTTPGTPGVLSFAQLQTILQLLKSDGNAQIVQAPKLTVLDHHEATIFVGETVRFAEMVSASNQQGGVELAAQEATNSPVDTGFQILLIPHIVPGTDKVIITLIPQRNTLDGFDLYEFGVNQLQISLPRVSSDTVITKMLLRDKETAIIGGLVDESEDEVVRKVPFLGDIPIVGWLFKRQSIVKTRRNLIIFVTVYIIRRSEDMGTIYSTYADYDAISPEFFTPFDLERRRRAEEVTGALREPFEQAVALFEQGRYDQAKTAFEDLPRRARRQGVKLGPDTREAISDYLRQIEQGPPQPQEPGWKQTPEGIEYSVPAKGAEKEEAPVEVELAPE